MTHNNLDDDYEEWSNIWSALSTWFQSDYVDLDELAELVANEFINKINQGHEVQNIHLAEEVLNVVVPLPNGVGISMLMVPGQLDEFDRDLQRAFEEDYEIMQNQPSDPDV